MEKLFRKKWKKYNLLIESVKLQPHIPKTQIFSYGNYLDFLTEFTSVYLKPNDGRRGRGIIKVTSLGANYYEIHHENEKIQKLGIVRSYNHVKKIIGEEAYLVQQPVNLAKIGERIMEFRVITQRESILLPWEVTGMVVKVGGEGFIVSNTDRSNGNILTVEDAFKTPIFQNYSPEELKDEIEKVVLQAAVKLTREFEKKRIYGFDVGVDNDGKVWIIEANNDPMMSHFRKLDDKSMLKRIKKIKQNKKKI